MEALLEIGVRAIPVVGRPAAGPERLLGRYIREHARPQRDPRPRPGRTAWVNACGFSGHGLIQAPVAGELVAEQIAHGTITSIDVSHLAIERFSKHDEHSDQEVDLVF